PFEKIGLGTRHARVRRAQEAVELAPAAAEPDEAQQAEQRAAVRRLRQAAARRDRDGYSERAEAGLERCAPALQGWADDRDPLRRRARADEREHLAADELERRPRARAFEEADGAADLLAPRRIVVEEVPLDVRERRVRELVEPR